jgi:hypothetical protein
MSPARPILVLIVAAAVCACSAQSAPGYAWSYQQDEYEGAKLAYGAPNSDDVLLMMTCAPRSGQVRLSAVTERAHEELVLASGRARDRFAGEVQPDELGGLLLEARAGADARSLSGFARTGKLSMAAFGETVNLAAGPDERPGVSRFFEVCRA